MELGPYVEDLRVAQRREVLARTRVQNFWGGVYKQFAVTGPNKYWLKIAKNDSFNTMVAMVLCDKLAGPTLPYEDMWVSGLACLYYQPRVIPYNLAQTTESEEVREALALGKTLKQSLAHRGVAARRHGDLLQALRAARAADAPERLLNNWRWHVHYWTPADRAAFEDIIRHAWAEHLRHNPHLRGLNI